MRFKTNIERKNWLKYNNKKPKDSKKEKEEKSLLELRSWEKDDYIPNPTASVYPYNYTPKFTKFGFLEIQPNLELSGTAGFGFPKQGINADFVGTMPLKSNPFYKGSIGGGISKQLGDFNLGLNLSNQIAGYTDESGKFIQGVHDSEGKFIENKFRDLSKINPTIKLKYNFTNGGKVSNIPTWNYPSKGTPIYRDTTEIPSNKFPHGGYHSANIFEEPEPEPKPINPYYNIQALQDKDLEFQDKWKGHKEYDPIGIQLTAEMFEPVAPWYVEDTLAIKPFDQLRDKEGNLKFDKRGNPVYKEPTAWSGATTSNLAMAMLGATNAKEAAKKGFRVSAGHTDYIQEAFNTNFENEANKYNLYRAQKLNENILNNLEIGEFVFKGREETFGWDYEDFEKAAKEKNSYRSHADIIVGKGEDENGKYIEVSGGNVDDTYLHKKKYYLDEVAQKYAGAMKFSEIAKNQQLLSTEGPGIAELPILPIQSIKDNVPTVSRQNIMSLDDMLKAKRLKEEALMNKVFAPNIKTNY